MKQHTQEKEQHDDAAQVERATTESQMDNQIGEAYQCYYP